MMTLINSSQHPRNPVIRSGFAATVSFGERLCAASREGFEVIVRLLSKFVVAPQGQLRLMERLRGEQMVSDKVAGFLSRNPRPEFVVPGGEEGLLKWLQARSRMT
ncbi:MAG TPA: hypothetical protein VGM86_32690 [Thermoanaerobaculia bacterium]|jgi:hypothetical protein